MLFCGHDSAWLRLRHAVSIRGSNSRFRRLGQRLADGAEDFFVRREKDESLPRDEFVADANGELAEVALDQFGLHSEFAFKHGRHTGSSGLVRRSGLAVTDEDGVHDR